MTPSKVKTVQVFTEYDPREDSLTMRVGPSEMRVSIVLGKDGIAFVREEKTGMVVGVKLHKYKFRLAKALGEDVEISGL